jgi:4-phospho-D-threonate 3-dehydrogenase / 4-phospho-D-erythronate 3-dehydrogenase
VLEWLTVADDRTGALEVAGEMAPWLGPLVVTVRTAPAGATAAVVDIGSRHVPPAVAAERAVTAASGPAHRRAHKIDSLLRGNWAHELVALQRAAGDRVLLVPASPQLGRTCRGGVVHVDGVPVGAHDARRATVSPRAAEHLVAAGGIDVAELADAAAVGAWLRDGGSFGVCDASTSDDLASIAEVWRDAEGVRFAGTAGSISAAVAATAGITVDRPPVTLDGEALVVCGSLHATARAQIGALRSASVEGVVVLASPLPDPPSVSSDDAERVAAELGAAARELVSARPFGVVVIIGGDTAAAVLEDEPMVVGGTLASGVPWSRRADGSGPIVITKAGGFGHPTALVELLAGRRASVER